MLKDKRKQKGFTLLEILLVIAAIGILAAIVLVAINPTKQIESARSAQRRSDINSITKAIQQYSIDNNGQYPTGIEVGAKVICNTGSQKSTDTLSPTTLCDNKANLSVLVPTYIASIPQPDSNNYYVRKSSNSIEVSHPRDTIWNIGGVPSLDLNFAQNKSLIDGVSGNNLITFARNSTATYIGEDGLIKTAAINEPRFDHDPTTRDSLGLLVEEQRGNLLVNSEQFGDSIWTKGQTNISINSTTAPDGTLTADTVTASSGVGYKDLYQAFTSSATANTAYTFSVFVKANGITFFTMVPYFNGGSNESWFNLSTGTALTNTSGNTSSITNYGNGWYRLTVTRTSPTTLANALFIVRPSGGDGDGQYNGNGVNSFYIWGAQVEAGSFPTSYIPTTSSQATRAADVVSIAGTNFSSWYNQSEGTIFSSARMTFNPTANSNFPAIYTTGSFPDRLFMLYLNQPAFNSLTVGADTHSKQISTFSTSPQNFKVAQALSNNSLSYGVSKDGATALTGSISKAITNTSSISIAGNVGSANHIARLTYWPTRLSDKVLQLLTQ